MQFSSSDLFRFFFSELERLQIPYVIIHAYEQFPGHVSSDVDFAVLTRDLPKLAPIQSNLAEKHGWRLAHALEAHIYAFYSVLIDREDPRTFLQLDACGHYVENNCFLISDEDLLRERRRFRDFYVPAPAIEFGYLLAKALAKSQPLAAKMPRLKELWQLAPEQTERQFQSLCGGPRDRLENWFDQPASQWEALARPMLQRHRFRFSDQMREVFRAFKRVSQPAGLHIALLGPDGCGKSTLLERAGPLIETPFFRRQLVFHFRPKTFEPGKPDSPVIDPHSKPPRNPIVGLFKLIYYFADNLAGFISKVFPAKVRNELVLFCRDFDDVLVDPRRYRFQGVGFLARLLRRLLPKPDLTFVLDAEPEEIRARKPELSIEELRRQRDCFKNLAASNPGYFVVSSAQPPNKLAQEVCIRVVDFLAQRQRQRDNRQG